MNSTLTRRRFLAAGGAATLASLSPQLTSAAADEARADVPNSGAAQGRLASRLGQPLIDFPVDKRTRTRFGIQVIWKGDYGRSARLQFPQCVDVQNCYSDKPSSFAIPSSVLLASKPQTRGRTWFPVSHSVLDDYIQGELWSQIHSIRAYLRKWAQIDVRFIVDNKLVSVSFGGQTDQTPKAVRSVYSVDGLTETEWLVAATGTASAKNYDLIVRFFELPAASVPTRAPNAHWVPGLDLGQFMEKKSANSAEFQALRPVFAVNSAFSVPGYSLMTLPSGSDTVPDILAVPSRNGAVSMEPAGSIWTKMVIEIDPVAESLWVKLLNWLKGLRDKLKAILDGGQGSEPELLLELYNNVYAHWDQKRADIAGAVKTAIQSTLGDTTAPNGPLDCGLLPVEVPSTADLSNLLNAAIAGGWLTPAVTEPMTKARDDALVQMASKPPIGTAGAGFGVSLLYQAKVGSDFVKANENEDATTEAAGRMTPFLRSKDGKGYWIGASGLGIRASLRLASWNATVSNDKTGTGSYSIVDGLSAATKAGAKFSITVILIPSARWHAFLNYSDALKAFARKNSVALELTLYFTANAQHPTGATQFRWDGFQFDPVFDSDAKVTESKLWRVVKDLCERYATPVVANVGASLALPANVVGTAASAFASLVGTYTGGSRIAPPEDGTSPTQPAREVARTAITNIANEGKAAFTEVGVLEFSPLRFMMVNKENSTINPIVTRCPPSNLLFAWKPGVKYLTGTRLNLSTSFLGGAAWVRIIVLADGYCVFGSPGYVDAWYL
jgi:hypothetical protein